MTKRALQAAFKRCMKRAGLPSRYSIHCLRHTYACFLLKASNWNLRLVQKQLGHARISTTQVYADVMLPDIQAALERLDGETPATTGEQTGARDEIRTHDIHVGNVMTLHTKGLLALELWFSASAAHQICTKVLAGPGKGWQDLAQLAG